MGQSNILELIEKSKKPLMAKEISKILGINRSSVATSLKKLRDMDEVGWKMENKIIYVYFKKQ